jgi:hypothetical protein
MEQVYHSWDKWECYKNGFYKTSPPNNLTNEECENIFRQIITSNVLFNEGINMVFANWKYSCEHFLTNKSINRVAWLGQAAVCILTNIPSKYRISFRKISIEEQIKANKLAENRILQWENDYKKNK